tara:strand:- start:1287 stop:2894 length:1608 start_codon:yes stop_codon:yes gene_type:complete
MRNLYTLFLCAATLTTYAQTTVQDDFEGNGTITSWQQDDSVLNSAFSNPIKEGINTSNTVLKYDDIGGQYANVYFDIPEKYDLSENYTFSFKIYIPQNSITGSQNNQVSVKLQNNDMNTPWSSQSEIIKDVSLDQWQTISFNFKDDNFSNYDSSAQNPTDREDFDRILIQVNGENNTDTVTAYIDDFLYDGTITPENNPVFDQLVWSDEFDGFGAIDTGKWFQQVKPIINGQSWANGEIQHYTDRIGNSYVSNGSLKILAKKESYTYQGVEKDYTSARLNSKYAFTYGKVEIKAKLPFGVGTFPALWMLGQNITETGGYWAESYGTTGWPDCGEIDIIEHWGDNQNYVASALHNRSSFGGTINKGGRSISNASTEFHIYTLEWTSDKMIFSVDGIEHYRYNPQNKDIQNWPYDAPQYLLFNVAILPNVTSSFTESAMEIDYVRVYQEATASISDVFLSEKVKLIPNPINDELTIQIDDALKFEKAILYSITGKKIHTFLQKSSKKRHDTSFLKKGMYLLKIVTADGSKTFKLVKN